MRQFMWASLGMYFLGGMVGVIFGSVMPEWLGHYGATYTTGGLVVLLQSIGFMVGVPVATYAMRRFPYQHVLSMSAFSVAVSQFVLLLLPPLQVVCAFAVLNGMGASALETAVASYIMQFFIGQRAVAMGRLEVAFGLGALGLPALCSAFIALHVWRLSFLIVGVIALTLAIVWQTISFSMTEKTDMVEMDAKTEAPPQFTSGTAKGLILAGFLFLILLYVGLEASLNSFLPSIFGTYLKVVPYLASLSVTIFWIAMVAGRAAIGFVARRINYQGYLFFSFSATVVGLIFLALRGNIVFSFVSLVVLGIAMSAIYSITMVYANHTFPGMEHTVTGLVTGCAGIGGAVLPVATGFFMDHFLGPNILWMFVGIPIISIASLVAIVFTLRGLAGRMVRN